MKLLSSWLLPKCLMNARSSDNCCACVAQKEHCCTVALLHSCTDTQLHGCTDADRSTWVFSELLIKRPGKWDTVIPGKSAPPQLQLNLCHGPVSPVSWLSGKITFVPFRVDLMAAESREFYNSNRFALFVLVGKPISKAIYYN